MTNEWSFPSIQKPRSTCCGLGVGNECDWRIRSNRCGHPLFTIFRDVSHLRSRVKILSRIFLFERRHARLRLRIDAFQQLKMFSDFFSWESVDSRVGWLNE